MVNDNQLKGAVRHLRGRAESTIGGVTGRARTQVNGAVDQAAGGIQYAAGNAEEYVRDEADTLLSRARNWLDEAGEQLHSFGQRTHRNTVAPARQQIQEQPLAAAALAFAGGLIIGLLSRRR